MVTFPTKYDKTNVSVLDHITVHCDKRDGCDRDCPSLTTNGLKQVKKDDVAYIEPKHCPRFRSVGGNVEGAEIREIGLWK